MKYVSIGIVLAVLVALLTVSILFVDNTAQRETEFTNAIEASAKEVLEEAVLRGYTFASAEEGEGWIRQEFEEKLNQKIINGTEENRDKNLEVAINYKAVDISEGILSVEATEKYTHTTGEMASITKTVTVVLDESRKLYKDIIYKVDDHIYRRYKIDVEDNLIPPTPKLEGKAFLKWEEDKTKSDDKTMVYNAVFA